jgi:hypothetical protein
MSRKFKSAKDMVRVDVIAARSPTNRAVRHTCKLHRGIRVSNLIEKPVAANGEKDWIFGRKIGRHHGSRQGSGLFLRRGKSPCPAT